MAMLPDTLNSHILQGRLGPFAASIDGGVAPPITLADLTGTFTLPEDAALGDLAGTISGKRMGSTLSLVDDAGGRVALDGIRIERGATALTGDGGNDYSFTVRETLAIATNSPHDTVFSLAVEAVAPPYDFFVTNDAEFIAADSAATAGQVIMLADAGTFTDLVLSNNTGVTVTAETYGVPVVRSFKVRGATGATVENFAIQANAMPSGAPKLFNMVDRTGSTCDGLVVRGLTIRGGNPWDGFADFDPTVTDVDQMGTNGDWGAANGYVSDLWYGIGNQAAGGEGIPSGDISILDCTITDLREGIKFSYGGNGYLKVNGNTIARCYQDLISFGLPAPGAGPVDGIEVCGNEGYDAFAQPQDNLNPHGDFIQFFTDDNGPTTYDYPVPNMLIAGNIHWYTPGARGQTQRIFVSDIMDGYPLVAPVIVDNFMISRITNKGVTVASTDVVQTGSVWGYFYRNTVLCNPSNNTPFQNEVFTNSVSGIGPSAGTALASIEVLTDPSYPEACNWIADNITEFVIPSVYHISSGNILTGRGSNATSYGSSAIPDDDAEWNALADAEDYFAAFQTVANTGKGAGVAGNTAAAIRAAWADPLTRPWASMPSWVGWRNLTNVTASTLYTTDWAFVHAGGPGASRSLAITGGEYRLADDKDGTNATSWTSASGTVANGKYMQVRQTSSDDPLTPTSVSLTIGATSGILWTITTETLAEYPIVAFGGGSRYTKSGTLGSDNRYCTIAFKMKFPNSVPGTSTFMYLPVNSLGGVGSLGVRVQILNSNGLVRLDVYNSAGTIVCALNMTGSSPGLCDGNVHEVMITIDMDQASAASGRLIYVDGIDRTSASGAWSGGSGVVIGYSRTTGLGGYSIGGSTAAVLPSDVEMHYLYLNIAERADITDSLVRAKFDATAIGADGSGVTGNVPHTFVTGTAAQWNDVAGINWGSGANYALAAGTGVTDVSGSPWP